MEDDALKLIRFINNLKILIFECSCHLKFPTCSLFSVLIKTGVVRVEGAVLLLSHRFVAVSYTHLVIKLQVEGGVFQLIRSF